MSLKVSGPVTDFELTPQTTDSAQVRKLKDSHARQIAIHEAACKTLMDVMSIKYDQQKVKEDEHNAEVASLKEQLRQAQLQLARQEQKAVRTCSCSVNFLV